MEPDERAQKATVAKSVLVLGFRACVVIALLVGMYFAIREGAAAWYFRGNQPQDVERAVKWDPGNPEYADALAHLTQFYSANPDPNRSVQLCETATRLSPNDAHYWADLGSAYDRAGRADDANRAFEKARELFPNSPDINWRLSNFYVRTNRASYAVPLLQKVLDAGGVDDKQVFSLASRTGIDNTEIVAKMLPARGPVFVDYLNFLVASGRLDTAKEVWASLLKSGLQFGVSDAFPYFDALIHSREVDTASRVWRELGERFPGEVRLRNSLPNLVTNGDFDFAILNGGFDWRIIPTAGATVTIEPAERTHRPGLLRIDFNGSQNPEYGGVFQLIPVEPRTRYQFGAEVRTEGITTDSGPRFQIFDEYTFQNLFVSTPNRIGSSGWSRVQLSFQTGADTRLVLVRVERPASQKFDNKISGTLWLRHVSLVESIEQ